jgi:lysozyme
MSLATKSGAVIALLIGIVGSFEGLRQTAYQDVVGVWTVCYGHTEGVKRGDKYSLAQCKGLLREDLAIYAKGIDNCVKKPLPDKRWVALVSFAYNVGVKAACNSSVVRLINAGKTKEGCNALLKWNKAGGVTFPGLTKRRQKERELCLAG